MSRRSPKAWRVEHAERHIRLHHWLMKTQAWRSLDPVARCAYIELASRYFVRKDGSNNNGEIPYSVREAADALNSSKATALRALRRLQEHGFIVEVTKGAFSQKVRHSTEWQLTEFPYQGSMATKDFARWQKQNTVSPEHPNGCRDETERVSQRTGPRALPPPTVSRQHPTEGAHGFTTGTPIVTRGNGDSVPVSLADPKAKAA